MILRKEFERSEAGDNPRGDTYNVPASVPGPILAGLAKESATHSVHFMGKLGLGELKDLTEGLTLSK